MSARLVIRPDAGGGPAVDWLFLDDANGESRFGDTDVSDLKTLAQQFGERVRRVDLILPGVEILCRRVELPARTEAQARAALAFLLEDDLADPPEAMHFALGRTGDDDRRSVCALAKDRYRDRLSVLAEAGLAPDRVAPDYLLLGAEADVAVILEDEGRMTVALGPDAGFAAETELGRLVLGEMLETAEIARLRLHAEDTAGLEPPAGWGERPLEIFPVPGREATLRLMASRLDQAAIDLRQGDFARRRGLPAQSRKTLAAVAATAALLVAAGAAQLFIEATRYGRLADRAEARIEQVFRAALPETARIVNPAAQLATARARLSGGAGDGFLALAETLAAGIAAVDGVRLASLRYADEGRGLRAELVYRNFDDLEAIKTAVAARGARLEETAARQENGQVVGSILLEPGR